MPIKKSNKKSKSYKNPVKGSYYHKWCKHIEGIRDLEGMLKTDPKKAKDKIREHMLKNYKPKNSKCAEKIIELGNCSNHRNLTNEHFREKGIKDKFPKSHDFLAKETWDYFEKYHKECLDIIRSEKKKKSQKGGGKIPKRKTKGRKKVKTHKKKKKVRKTKKKTKTKIIIESCEALEKEKKTKKTRKKKDNAIIYMKEDCPHSKEAYKTLVKKFGKNNVLKRIIESKEIEPIRKGLSEKYKNTDGNTVPFMVINNKKFIGTNDELQKMN